MACFVRKTSERKKGSRALGSPWHHLLFTYYNRRAPVERPQKEITDTCRFGGGICAIDPRG